MQDQGKSPRGGWMRRLLTLAPQAARPPETAEVVFPPGFLASLERLRVAALKALGGGLREGHRLGAYKGGQLEFHGHRSYTPGDELRYVDWNTYARLGRPYVKEFAREEAGVLHILLDGTASMELGTPAKWTFARRLAALFAHVALASRDVVYLHLFDSTGEVTHFPLRGARVDSAAFLSFLEHSTTSAPPLTLPSPQRGEGKQPPANVEPLAQAATQFLRSGPLRGGMIVLSDFWFSEQTAVAAISALAAAGFEVSAIHILAPEEIAPALSGDVLARSVEDEDQVNVFFSGDLAARYAAELERHRQAIETTIRRRGGNYLLAASDKALERVLLSVLRQRRWIV